MRHRVKHRRGGRGGITAGTVALLLAACGAPCRVGAQPTTPAPPLTFVERDQDDLYLMALRFQSVLLSDTLECFTHPSGDLFLPLGEVCRLLELGVSTSPEEGTASGFLIREDRKFSLDARTGEARVGKRQVQFYTDQVEIHNNDIYLLSQLISELLPVKLQIDHGGLMITALGDETLPLQMRLERERRGAQAREYLPQIDRGYPRVEVPHRVFDGPFIDHSLVLEAGNGRGFDVQYSALIAADLFGMTNETYVDTGGAGFESSIRTTMSRSDPAGNLLGPLRAREVAFGHVVSPELPLLSASELNAGVSISSYPLNEPDEFDTHTFRGNVPPGWDVELYRNDTLVDYQPASAEGLYEFRDTPLLFGLNQFRLVFHGPHGERREQRQVFNVGPAMLQPGQNVYRLCWNKQETGGTRVLLQSDWGVADNLSLGGSLVKLDLLGDAHEYGSVSARGYWSDLYGRLDTTIDTDGGWATKLGLQTRLGRATLTLQHTLARDFQSEYFRPNTDQVEGSTQLRLDNLRLPRSMRLLPANLEYSREARASGRTTTRIVSRLSSAAPRTRVSNYLRWEQSSGGGAESTDTLDGSLLASWRARRRQIRGELTYGLSPSTTLRSASVTWESYLTEGRTLGLGLQQSLEEDDTRFLARYDWTHQPVYYGIAGTYSTNGTLEFGMRLSSFLGRDGRSGRWEAKARGSADQGAVSALVWLDVNRDGICNPSEERIPGVGFFVNGVSHQAVTQADGIAFIGGMSSYQPTDISISSDTLEDPLWVPSSVGVRITPRPGVAQAVNFPVVATAEVTGTVRIRRATGVVEAAGVLVELVDEQGAVENVFRSAYDGFFDITHVAPGRYTLRVNVEHAAKLQVKPAEREFVIPEEGGFVDGIDLTLEPVEP